jgi:hypothetical protein
MSERTEMSTPTEMSTTRVTLLRAIALPVLLALGLFALAGAHPALAFFHAGGWGGAAGGHWAAAGGGHWAAGGWGHTTSGTYGTTANGTHYATGENGGAVVANNGHYAAVGPNGGYAYGSHYTYGGGSWTAVHSPTVVNQYNTGCYSCGGWSAAGAAAAAGVTGLAVGTAVGATAAAAAARPPVYTTPYVLGDVYAALPVGCAYSPYGGSAYYNCAGTWFSPYYGANGMYYRVVPVP